MKIRAAFVTNSSSSSFVHFTIHSKELCNLLLQYKNIFERGDEDDCRNLILDEDHISYTHHEGGGYTSVPGAKEHVLNCFKDFVQQEMEILDDLYGEEDDIDYFEKADEIIEKIEGKEEIITEDIEKVVWENIDYGWGGDSEPLYWEDFSDEEREPYLQIIAKELNKTIEEVSKEDFDRYSCCSTSSQSYHYLYDKNANIDSYHENKELNPF